MISISRKKKPLHCSFCGKSEKEVARLLAGPKGVYICDMCVGACGKILEAVPSTFAAGWASMDNEQLLGALKSAEASVEGTRSILQAQINVLRDRGVSWEVIGKALGISRQAAWERFS